MFSFENLEVYKKTVEANQLIYRHMKEESEAPQYAKNQLGRATLSILLNIAEGSGKFTDKDRRNFYVTARASAFESYALAQFLNSQGDLPPTLYTELSNSYELISKMLFGMIRKLEEENT